MTSMWYEELQDVYEQVIRQERDMIIETMAQNGPTSEGIGAWPHVAKMQHDANIKRWQEQLILLDRIIARAEEIKHMLRDPLTNKGDE